MGEKACNQTHSSIFVFMTIVPNAFLFYFFFTYLTRALFIFVLGCTAIGSKA